MTFKQFLAAKNITPYRLSQISGISKTTIHDICSGKSAIENCSIKTVYQIAKALNTNIEVLLQCTSVSSAQMDTSGKPSDQSYLERGLPAYLYDSIAAMQKSWDDLDHGRRNTTYDLDFCELQADINRAEVDELISTEQAWYLREKYLRVERESS